MQKRLTIFSKELPIWFKLLNLCILLPILLWPFVLYLSIFIFDNPHNLALAYLIFFALIAYPLYLLIIAELNSRLYFKNKRLSLILPILIFTFIVVGALYIARLIFSGIEEKKIKQTNRKLEGWIGDCDTYRNKNGKIYFNDTIVKGIDAKTAEEINCFYIKDSKQVYNEKEAILDSDPNTFEILSWEWQKDRKKCYYLGKPINYIDVKTFTLLQNNYSKDKKNVYYYDKQVVGADAKTFDVDDITYIGKDKYGEYENGERIKNSH